MTTDDREAFRVLRDAGLRKRHEQRLARAQRHQGDTVTTECPHCPDGHTPFQAGSHPWNVYVAPARDGDGQPTHLIVQRSAGEHCAQSDADALYELINGRKP